MRNNEKHRSDTFGQNHRTDNDQFVRSDQKSGNGSSNKKDAFKSRYAWHIERSLDIDKMNEFCNMIIGTHDFAAFCSSGSQVETTVRTISECYVKKQGDEVTLTVTADGFLYNMVRIIVGTAVAVSDGRVKLGDIPKILETQNREGAGMTAPAHGLFLEKVLY
jgi:tRNA pseudouridine38-40 synthase